LSFVRLAGANVQVDDSERPFNLGDVLGVESLWFKQLLTLLSGEQQALHHQLTQNQSHDLAHVHARYHLLKPTPQITISFTLMSTAQ